MLERSTTRRRQKLYTAVKFWSESDWEAAETAHGCKVLVGIRLANGRKLYTAAQFSAVYRYWRRWVTALVTHIVIFSLLMQMSDCARVTTCLSAAQQAQQRERYLRQT